MFWCSLRSLHFAIRFMTVHVQHCTSSRLARTCSLGSAALVWDALSKQLICLYRRQEIEVLPVTNPDSSHVREQTAKFRDSAEQLTSRKKAPVVCFLRWMYFVSVFSDGERRYNAVMCGHAVYFRANVRRSRYTTDMKKKHTNCEPAKNSQQQQLHQQRTTLIWFVNIRAEQNVNLYLGSSVPVCCTLAASSRNNPQLLQQE